MTAGISESSGFEWLSGSQEYLCNLWAPKLRKVLLLMSLKFFKILARGLLCRRYSINVSFLCYFIIFLSSRENATTNCLGFLGKSFKTMSMNAYLSMTIIVRIL